MVSPTRIRTWGGGEGFAGIRFAQLDGFRSHAETKMSAQCRFPILRPFGLWPRIATVTKAAIQLRGSDELLSHASVLRWRRLWPSLFRPDRQGGVWGRFRGAFGCG